MTARRIHFRGTRAPVPVCRTVTGVWYGTEAGVASVSSPVRDRTGRVITHPVTARGRMIAAIGIGGPIERMGRRATSGIPWLWSAPDAGCQEAAFPRRGTHQRDRSSPRLDGNLFRGHATVMTSPLAPNPEELLTPTLTTACVALRASSTES